jgi:hypothetical protein
MPSLQRALASADSLVTDWSDGPSGDDAGSLALLGSDAVSTPPWWEQAPCPPLELVPSRHSTVSPVRVPDLDSDPADPLFSSAARPLLSTLALPDGDPVWTPP